MRRGWLLCLLLLTTFSVQGQGNHFFQEKERGWYWYEDPPPEKKKEIPEQEPSPPPTDQAKQTGPKPFSAQWLRDNLDRLRDDAIDNPDDEAKVAAFLYAQRVLMDKAQRFATAASTLAKSDPLLDETNRVPMDAAAASLFQRAIHANQDDALKKLSEIGGIFFFYDSTCRFCPLQQNSIDHLAQKYGFTVKNVSVDGKPLPGMRDWVKDTGQARALGLSIFPTTIFAVPPDKWYIVSQGYHATDTLASKIMLAASSAKLLPKEMIERSHAYDRGVLSAEDLRDREISEDPNKFVEQLRRKLGARY